MTNQTTAKDTVISIIEPVDYLTHIQGLVQRALAAVSDTGNFLPDGELTPEATPEQILNTSRAVVFTPEVDCLLTSLASGCPDLEEGTGADPYTVTAESTLEGLSRGALDEVLRTAYDLGLAVDAAANIEKVKRDMTADPELTLSAAHTAAFSPDSEPWSDTDEEF